MFNLGGYDASVLRNPDEEKHMITQLSTQRSHLLLLFHVKISILTLQIVLSMSYGDYTANSTDNYSSASQRPQRTVLNFGSEDDTSVRDALLKESDHISRSEQLLDEQFEIAIKTRENLVDQRWAIKSMQKQYNDITSRFQTIGTLVKKIGIRKRRDTIIVAIVFSVCLVLFLWKIL